MMHVPPLDGAWEHRGWLTEEDVQIVTGALLLACLLIVIVGDDSLSVVDVLIENRCEG